MTRLGAAQPLLGRQFVATAVRAGGERGRYAEHLAQRPRPARRGRLRTRVPVRRRRLPPPAGRSCPTSDVPYADLLCDHSVRRRLLDSGRTADRLQRAVSRPAQRRAARCARRCLLRRLRPPLRAGRLHAAHQRGRAEPRARAPSRGRHLPDDRRAPAGRGRLRDAGHRRHRDAAHRSPAHLDPRRAARPGAALPRGKAQGRSREPQQDRVPRPSQPRHPHAAQPHHRLCRTDAARDLRAARRRALRRLCGVDRHLRRAAARLLRRDPRPGRTRRRAARAAIRWNSTSTSCSISVARRFLRAGAAQGHRAGARRATAVRVLVGDRFSLERMLGNLVDNAIRYTPPRGTRHACGLCGDRRRGARSDRHRHRHERRSGSRPCRSPSPSATRR